MADLFVKQQQEIQRKPEGTALQFAIRQATDAILGARGGAARLLDTDGDGMTDTIYVADNADPNLAQQVWRWNYAGWGVSKNGYNGPFVMAATLDGGFVADFITSGSIDAEQVTLKNLNADEIKSGSIDAEKVKLKNLDADNITSGKLKADFIDVDNLATRKLKATAEYNGYTVTVETDEDGIQFTGNDGTVSELLAAMGIKEDDENYATAKGYLELHQIVRGTPGRWVRVGPTEFTMGGATVDDNILSLYVADDGTCWIKVDSIGVTGLGNCKWEYIPAIGKTVLALK